MVTYIMGDQASGKDRIYPSLREKVSASFQEMHKYFEQRYTPKVKWSKSCNACSLKDICMPVLNKNLSVSRYIDQKIKEKDGD